MNNEKVAAGALAGIRVLDFGQYLSAPMVAMFLADNGADVIHVDPVEGPRWDHPTNAALQRGKRGIRLDLKSPGELYEAKRLVASADIVLENFRPGVMARLGLDQRASREANRRLIWCSLPGFATDDPRAPMRAWEGIVCSAAGLYPQHGFAAGDPVFTALPLASNFGAFVAAHRVAAALLTRLKTGHGQHIEVSLFEACFQAIGLYAEVPSSRDLSNTLLSRVRSVMRMRRAADGTYIYFDSPLRGLQAFLDRYLPGRNLTSMSPTELADTADRLDELILQKSGAEWERICQEEINGAFGLVQTLPAWLADEHALESETIVKVDDAIFGETIQPGYPVLLSKTRPSVRWGRGKADPVRAQVIDWLAPRCAEPSAAAATGLPLEGIRVVDCSTLLAGPTSARVLAQYGADVVKIDRAGIADGDVDPLSDDEFAFIGARTVSAGKRMMFLDLKTAQGQEVLRELVKRSDIVHHNFTPPAAQRLGVASEQLRAFNPSLILSTMSLHSHGGFRAEYRGHDMLGQMITGMGHRAGGRGDPQVVATVLNDNAAGHLHAFGIMLALLHRARTGEGQDVNCSLSGTATLHQVPFMVGYKGRVWDEPAGREARGWGPLDCLYRSRDGWFYMAAGRDNQEARTKLEACEILSGAPADGPALERFLSDRFSQESTEACVLALNEVGVSAHRHMSLKELAEDAYVTSHGYLAVVDHPGIGRALGVGQLVYDESASSRNVLQARSPGLDTVSVLEEIGFGGQFSELLENKVVATDSVHILNRPLDPDFWTKSIGKAQGSMAGIAIDAHIVRHIRDASPSPVFEARPKAR
jgi:crotonobetainyl-CoA:carnitine CoA-transferase CaiB-like acyl-CoA transferase